MKILILDEDYPHDGNIIGDQFVHVRVKEYIKKIRKKIDKIVKTHKNCIFPAYVLSSICPVVHPSCTASILHPFLY